MFIRFVANELGITNPYKVVLSNDRSKFKTTAYYNPQTGELGVYKNKRALIDIMRSAAHELVHHQQNQKSLLTKGVKDIGGPIEDEANAVAGQLIKKFGYAHPKLDVFNL